ncbi:MAG TPA: oligosaccharide flippase family protein, partial [Verrucomicrobiota bacterium]|nr:oligosaccharide flippase family protein [Verrucomicrobiota bacterium]
MIAAIPRPLRPWWDRLEQSPWGTRLARGAFWSVTGGVVARGLSLLASILVARILGKDVFGELGTVQSTIGMFTVFAGLGMGLTATKHVAEFRLKDPARAGRIITLSNRIAFWASIVVALAMVASASGLASAVAAPHIAPALQIAALSLFLNGISGAQTGALAGLEAFRTIAGLNFITGVISFPLLVAGALWRGIEGSIWALSATAAVG